MMYSNIPSAQTLVLYFQSRGIKNIVISPGSRNAPLTLSFTKHPFFSCFSIVDERCAAFFALGIAQQLQEPVAVVCTSGSAMLNFYPAVAEAFYSDIPLVVVSADRPTDKIDIGDGQTIRQEHIFEKHIGYSANLKQDSTHGFEPVKSNDSQETIQAYNALEIGKALDYAFKTSSPVHINIPFEEPLYDLVENPTVELSEVQTMDGTHNLEADWSRLLPIWNSSQRKMVLIGVNPPEDLDAAIMELLANDESVLVFTETTSNVHHPNFFPSIDSIVAPIEKSSDRENLFKSLQPDLLVTLGGLIVSKKIKAFLRKYQPKHHWHIDSKKAYDTFYCLSEHITTHPNTFFGNGLGNFQKIESSYRNEWLQTKNNYELKRQAYLDKIAYSDFIVFHQIQSGIPKDYQVHLANSSTVRYNQLFPMDPSLHVYCNRGTSGIDGSTSTAIGASIYYNNPSLLITGDLSFFYDSNGLWNQYIRPDFRIILINNSGGGIFRILPGFEETKEFSTFFETSHQHKAKHLAQMFQFEYIKAGNEKEVELALKNFYEPSQKPKILEIFTPRQINNKILLSYFDFIS
ncbi:2-succinyl-5-enolpyruvyl-6-hydroxy-3-cyclohexene-1-carboxylic-acid synthase [Flagellimonas algicola]|uniref:2-succinyl-5-enolpyruvyl-6-hydroxy-3-cyclohexene-1-carboxylate synthase n=1 Tax=Flagellimonas algicola TaxID=2583815 RepID=A0ABY2WNP6_9FLAO|nr:2-succinyl-5-enolpyruvyl-6-hydroxy-3-cyclohexene-1-carboxylic-acid synthase [Allomuricauda algicola]TMU56286.1 2-succinyl-5-enolpyruvyl-6-hydroxy-3-cyclohexene-1-carboxylic-acid synthase [Allomuricauda algicola]